MEEDHDDDEEDEEDGTGVDVERDNSEASQCSWNCEKYSWKAVSL